MISKPPHDPASSPHGDEYARRQQLRQLTRAALHASRASMTLAGATFVAYAGNGALALMLVLLTCVLVLASRRSRQLAARSRVRAVSEAQVRRALRPLRREGWRVQHASDWPDTGDRRHSHHTRTLTPTAHTV